MSTYLMLLASAWDRSMACSHDVGIKLATTIVWSMPIHSHDTKQFDDMYIGSCIEFTIRKYDYFVSFMDVNGMYALTVTIVA